MRLVYLSLAWVLGICLGSILDIHWIPLTLLLSASLGAAFSGRRRRGVLLGMLCLAAVSGGALRFGAVPASDPLESYRGFFEMRGVVAADPDIKEFSTVLRLEVDRIRTEGGEWEEVSGMVQVYASKYPSFGDGRDFPYYRYGDLLQMEGSLESPRGRQEGEDFDFRDYLARHGIHTVVYSPQEISFLESGHKSRFVGTIYQWRRHLADSLDRTLPEPQCSVAKAMLLGERGSIPQEVRDDFSHSGAAHLLAISGLHVSIVCGLALTVGVAVFGRHRPVYLIVALATVWLYVAMSGMSASGVRAAIMGSVWLWADWIGRPRSAFTALTFAAAVMLAVSPRLLADVGFQLSYAAMAGLIFLTPIFQGWGKRLIDAPEGFVGSAGRFVISGSAVTLGAVLGTLPLIAYHFREISLMGLPATLLTLPAVPGIIVTAGLAGGLGLVSPAVGEVFGWAAWLFVTYVIELTDRFADLPFSSVDVRVSAPAVWSCYAVLLAAVWVPQNRGRMRRSVSRLWSRVSAVPGLASRLPAKWIILPLIVIAVLVWTAVLTASDGRLHVYVLDVGQGDAILVQRGNQQILIDGGPSGGKVCNEMGKQLPFWDRTIEMVVLTHPDDDHLGGLVDVLRRYDVEKVLTTGRQRDSGAYREWRKLIDEKGIDVVTARTGQLVVMDGGVELEVLHPCGVATVADGDDLNNNSIVLRLDYGNFSMLLTGDIGVESEASLLAGRGRLRSTVLKVGHHGAETSTSPEFLEEVSPMFAVVSVGAENRFGHPSQDVLERLVQAVGNEGVFLTADSGTIELSTNGKKLWIDP